jgi:AcrR family transcriptional regulator
MPSTDTKDKRPAARTGRGVRARASKTAKRGRGADTERPLRADARRNRGAVIAAARELFAEQGLDAQMEDIAHAAGVGVGTVYRHFPTKEDLVRALAADRFERMADRARAALERPDPWPAFCDFMRQATEEQAKDRGLAEVWASRGGLMRQSALAAGMMPLLSELVARAHEVGGLREDVGPEDVPMLICGLGRVIQAGEHLIGGNWERFLAIILDGLRAPAESKLPR